MSCLGPFASIGSCREEVLSIPSSRRGSKRRGWARWAKSGPADAERGLRFTPECRQVAVDFSNAGMPYRWPPLALHFRPGAPEKPADWSSGPEKRGEPNGVQEIST